MKSTNVYDNLDTEKRNPNTMNIDERSISDIVDIINWEDQKACKAVRAVKNQITETIKMVVDSFQHGGRLFYVGAGTSGRLGVLDASECPPTFSVSTLMVQGIIAGGVPALMRSVEGAEDNEEDGKRQIASRNVSDKDTVIGIAACGVTPFVLGALIEAKKRAAGTAFITCNPATAKNVDVDVRITPQTGEEVITGSTRMKAGTATKLILNTITTTAMIQIGKTYSNLMVDLNPVSNKLKLRAVRIIKTITGLDDGASKALFKAADNNVKVAIVMAKSNISAPAAISLLNEHNGKIKQALNSLKS